MFRSATFKLTIWYLTIITAISLVFSVVIYHFATNELKVGLYHQTLRIYRNFPVFTNDPMLRQSSDLATGSHHILLRLIYFNILVLLLAGIASYFLARRTLQPIEAAHERQRRFTADVSHELRTPLTSIKMTSEVALLDKAASKNSLRDALTSNLEDASQMSILINNLLRLTRLDEEQSQANFTQLSSNNIVDTAIEQTAAIATAKTVALNRSGSDSPLYGDRDALVQLLVIIIDNAIKYSPSGSTVSLASESVGDVSRLSVTDTGPGIPKDSLPHVFDRFYRADSSRTKSASNGFGLGLSIAKLICDRHHGHITLKSRPGEGTTAIIELPATPPAGMPDN